MYASTILITCLLFAFYLQDMGYTREQSSNALIIHGTVEKALEALSGLHGNTVSV